MIQSNRRSARLRLALGTGHVRIRKIHISMGGFDILTGLTAYIRAKGNAGAEDARLGVRDVLFATLQVATLPNTTKQVFDGPTGAVRTRMYLFRCVRRPKMIRDLHPLSG